VCTKLSKMTILLMLLMVFRLLLYLF